ncbi:MAG TPA: outer membrane protein assembly factor BamD [Candidatus Paceibacterota bacterium]|nr:outer membrane protein assembly factor BamD [Verrucomicrobiota bacterium]HRY47577.1 outer membrane protein assembly factor BamD [Candidatus Paceibacterota bacterium]HRZ99220.1 outer membrane protein assembly factor BamD [Candidatus Paceibacterota bacterium]
MKRCSLRWVLLLIGVCLLPWRCPAPLIYRAGEGWSYESVGGEKWERPRAKDQLEVAQNAFERKNYRVAQKSAQRVVKRWPLSDYAPRAQYLLGRSYEERRMDERAFRAYQKLLQKYPKVDNFNEVVSRQFGIANRFLAGQWFKLWGYIPFFPSMDKTAQMYADMIKTAPYSELAPQAQMNIGTAREKQKEFSEAVRAYIQAADLYRDQKPVAADALFKAGQAYTKQAREAEYDQSVAGKAIATFTDFIALHPDDPRIPEAQKTIENLRREQARGSYTIARFYEKRGRLDGALIYYNDVLLKDRNSPHAEEAQQRINTLKKRQEKTTPAKPSQEP